MGQEEVPVNCDWRLNERMYGALTGLNKRETREALGEAAFEELRRQPPPISPDSCYDPARSSRFSDVPAGELPKKESFEDTAARVLPFWKEEILPRAANGETVLIISSKNCLRALLMGVATHVPPEQMIDLDIPNCQPLVVSAHLPYRTLSSPNALTLKLTPRFARRSLTPPPVLSSC